ncbi:MAG: YqaJ viral recombinase family protein [Ramlibacter sp.]|nr:YqaJ viral recombinase family protein [Ramlibacter sp.]
MRKFYDVQQNTDAWQALRLGKATCSMFGCFMANYGKAFGEPAQREALRIALERLTEKKSEFSFSNDHMERGHEQEHVAKMLYAEETYSDLTNGGFFECGQYGDSPDALAGSDGVIEVKSVIAPTHYATIRRGSYDPAYKWQLVGHLDCTGRQWVDFVSYCSDFPEGSQLSIHRLHRWECEDELRMLDERRAEFLLLIVSTMNNINLKATT